MDKYRDVIITLLLFVGILLLGWIFIEGAPLGYTEAALLFLAGVIGAGAYWVGRQR